MYPRRLRDGGGGRRRRGVDSLDQRRRLRLRLIRRRGVAAWDEIYGKLCFFQTLGVEINAGTDVPNIEINTAYFSSFPSHRSFG